MLHKQKNIVKEAESLIHSEGFTCNADQRQALLKISKEIQDFYFYRQVYYKKEITNSLKRKSLEQKIEKCHTEKNIPVWVFKQLETICKDWKNVGNLKRKLKRKNIFLYTA